MNMSKFTFGGVDYLLIYNARVQVEMERAGLKLDDVMKQKKFGPMVDLLCIMSEAGDIYAKRHGLSNPGKLDKELLLDEIDLTDMSMPYAIGMALHGTRQVESQLPKKKDTTGAASSPDERRPLTSSGTDSTSD